MEESAGVMRAQKLARADEFQRLVARELAGAYRTAALMLGDDHEAEDATQDALLRAWERLDGLRDPDRAGAWFGRILINVCRDRLRERRTTIVRWAGQEVAAGPSRESVEREGVRELLAALSPDQRIAVVLRYYADLSIEEIARQTGSRTGTVKSRLHYGLRLLRAAYEARDRREEPRT